MTTAATHHGSGERGEPASSLLRVILVGRTGLDARLRLDPEVELVRVRTPLEAVGELAEPLVGERPAGTIVIVSPDADPAMRPPTDGQPMTEDPARAGEFLSALRVLDPRVRVLRLESQDGEAPARAGYDGIIRSDAPADILRAELRGPRPAETRAAQPEDTIVEAVLEGRRLIDSPTSTDEELVRLLLQGRDLTDAALGLIRRRHGGTDVRLAPAGEAPTEPCNQATVGWRGRSLGILRSKDIAPEALAAEASWLAAWLALRQQHVQLREAAFSDPLTGAHNRRFFDHFLDVAIDQARRQRLPMTVLVFDIDNFKLFNDQYGHGAGDEILREAVKLLRSVIRPSDKVCRIGGDEFAVIFHEPAGPRTPTSKPPADIFQIAQRFQRAICDHRFPKLGREAPATLTISGGLATYPWDGNDAESLLNRADELALQSKKAGKNCITLGPGAERARGEKLPS